MQARRSGAAACAVLGIRWHPRPKRSELRLLGAGRGAQSLGLAGASKVPTLRNVGCVMFLLLWVLPQVWGSSEVLGRSFLFRCLQISSFVNSSWMRTDALAFLGELQTHSWSHASDSISFVKPWAQGTFSNQQWDQLQNIFRGYRSSVTRDIQEFLKMLSFDYPAEIQVSAGCEVHRGNVSENFVHAAYQGEYILSFQGAAWESAPQAPPWVDLVVKVLNQDQGTKETVLWLLNNICPQFVNGLLETGKSELEKEVKPMAWLSSGPSPGPGRLLLVCHVSGFYPQPVWVMWMRDGTHTSVGLIILVVLTCLMSVFLLILGINWIRRRCSYEDIL